MTAYYCDTCDKVKDDDRIGTMHGGDESRGEAGCESWCKDCGDPDVRLLEWADDAEQAALAEYHFEGDVGLGGE